MTIKKQLLLDLTVVLQELGVHEVTPVIEYPADAKHGDYATNIALVVSKSLKKNPREVAQVFQEKLDKKEYVDKVEIAGPGFINVWIKSEVLVNRLKDNPFADLKKLQKGKKVVVEYTDPNPFKEFHIGHLYSNIVGESIARLQEATGATVWRADYFGDVGMHVAKALWGLFKKFEEDSIGMKDLASRSLKERIAYFGKAYALGATAYEEDVNAKEEMKELNFLIFKSAQEIVLPTFKEKPRVDYNKFIKQGKYQYEEVKKLYKIGREWSLAYFETIYERLGTQFDGYYPESRTGEYGYGMVLEGLKEGVFEKGEGGAIIFPGGKYGLHNRVFINALGLPTYEAKDLGNAIAKQKDFSYDLSVIVTGNEINEYFQVVIKALSMLEQQLGDKAVHIGHGMVRLPEGKMSSRTGKIKTGESMLDTAKEQALKLSQSDNQVLADQIGNAAIKYAFLKSSIGKDIIFDFEESVSFEGNSGPYLQYVFVRTQSVLKKAGGLTTGTVRHELQEEERELLKLLSRFEEAVEEAASRFAPNILCIYLFELAQAFNVFYQKCPILKEEDAVKDFRLFLTKATGETIKNGLNLLGIQAPERM